ncbi:hypothetical protein [Streptomyces sp. NPDC060031]|uniref:hypothetical protein n=1 Tax=Streptomyces sp. NPDC060031 TaxID=3347043 RepID=UPI0036B6F9CB
MSGTRRTRMALARALTVACVVLLCAFGAGPAAAIAASAGIESRPAHSAPAEPTEGPSDPAGDPEVRIAARPAVRGTPGVRRPQRPVFHVKHPGREPGGARCAGPYGTGTAAPAASPRTTRSVVLRC